MLCLLIQFFDPHRYWHDQAIAVNGIYLVKQNNLLIIPDRYFKHSTHVLDISIGGWKFCNHQKRTSSNYGINYLKSRIKLVKLKYAKNFVFVKSTSVILFKTRLYMCIHLSVKKNVRIHSSRYFCEVGRWFLVQGRMVCQWYSCTYHFSSKTDNVSRGLVKVALLYCSLFFGL